MKHPEPGKVKTRLAAGVGEAKAVAVYRALLERTLRVCEQVAADKQVHYGALPVPGDLWDAAGYARFAQQGDDLGQRMAHAFEQCFAAGYEQAVIIGSDCYELSPAVVEQAYAALATHEVVLGPSTDGGYYLLGMTRLHRGLFEGMAWSTESVADDTRKAAAAAGLSVAELPALTDIDTAEDLHTLPSSLRQSLGV